MNFSAKEQWQQLACKQSNLEDDKVSRRKYTYYPI